MNGHITAGRKTCAREAVRAITGQPDFSSGGTTHHLSPDKQAVYFLRQHTAA